MIIKMRWAVVDQTKVIQAFPLFIHPIMYAINMVFIEEQFCIEKTFHTF